MDANQKMNWAGIGVGIFLLTTCNPAAQTPPPRDNSFESDVSGEVRDAKFTVVQEPPSDVDVSLPAFSLPESDLSNLILGPDLIGDSQVEPTKLGLLNNPGLNNLAVDHSAFFPREVISGIEGSDLDVDSILQADSFGFGLGTANSVISFSPHTMLGAMNFGGIGAPGGLIEDYSILAAYSQFGRGATSFGLTYHSGTSFNITITKQQLENLLDPDIMPNPPVETEIDFEVFCNSYGVGTDHNFTRSCPSGVYVKLLEFIPASCKEFNVSLEHFDSKEAYDAFNEKWKTQCTARADVDGRTARMLVIGFEDYATLIRLDESSNLGVGGMMLQVPTYSRFKRMPSLNSLPGYTF
ncbi:hypothetical protein HN587_01430 [Candidatus Woesearchaeota archaeon]|jgi:hypothetical protein|nr:hypothetical protein [Candidatus Woesearchaeota archaeon]